MDSNLCTKLIKKRIVVVGPSGAGKSYFSKKLASILKLPLYHLDNIWWRDDKTHISRDDFDNKLLEILKKDKWIIDGDYSRTYEMRMDACDTIIFLDYSLKSCLAGVEERLGEKRVDLPWVEEELDDDFKKWIINWKKDILPKLMSLLNKYKESKEVYIFKTRKDANDYLNKMC